MGNSNTLRRRNSRLEDAITIKTILARNRLVAARGKKDLRPSSGKCSPKGEISMRLSCAGVPPARRAFCATEKTMSAPLSIFTTISPSRNDADRA